MPVTPVGQLPYPLGTDKPNIPTDIKNLANTADGWVTGMDNALDTRVRAVGTRLDAAASRITAVTGGLSTSTSNMSAGDTAITAAQGALSVVEARLASQDVTAAALQTRYNADNTALNTLSQANPLGLTYFWPSSSSINTSGTGQYWIAATSVTLNAMPNPLWRVHFDVQVFGDPSGQVEVRLTCSTGALSWSSYYEQADLGSPDSGNAFSFPMNAVVSPGALSAGTTVYFGLGVKGSGPAYTAYILSGNIQFLQTGN